METFFPTSAPASIDEMQAEITNLKQSLATAENMREHWERKHNELQQKIANVKGHIFDMYYMNGSVDDDIIAIAELLDITLMKEIQGTASFEISFTAQVPLDFDPEDFEISFDVNCEEYDAEDFDWNEEHTSIHAEEV